MKHYAILVAIGIAGAVQAQDAGNGPASVPQNPDREAFFGDMHLHTAYSFDAIGAGTRTTPEDAYRYARGDSVEYLGRPVRRQRPLDFLAVTDHSEYLGVPFDAMDPNGPLVGTPWPDAIAEADSGGGIMGFFSPSAFRGTDPPIEALRTEALVTTNWQREIDAAERFNDPGRFTTLVAYEWSPMPGGAHLHRNVIFRGPEYPDRPFSSLDSPRPEDLWSFVEALRERGIDSVLIPHNSNLSQGMMFATTDSAGDPITREYALRRLTNERLVEIAQNKGTSETRPEFGAPDEFANFELMILPAEVDADPAGGYVRHALGRGLEIEAAIGINPFRFGLIGSSDFHSGVSATEEGNFTGALGRSDDMQQPEQVLTRVNALSRTTATAFSAGAITGVWAESNTREAIFDALKRREAFATSGTRIRVRLFAGTGFADDFVERPDWIAAAYAQASPMGADLPRIASTDGPLQIAVHAARDPDGANLDRIQIVKIWREAGEAREAIFDVAWSGDREPDPATGRLPPVGNSVDLSTASYANTIGAAQLSAVWTDTEFDASVPTVYYARVLEIPTPRWSTYLAVRNGEPLPEDAPLTLQERAWTSPVFYDP